jgi:hypothetical protein
MASIISTTLILATSTSPSPKVVLSTVIVMGTRTYDCIPHLSSAPADPEDQVFITQSFRLKAGTTPWKYRTRARYRFSIVMFDADGKQICHIQREDVDHNYDDDSMTSRLPYILEIHTGNNDNDFVSFSYGSQSWTCDDHDGGAYSCTLGNEPEHGYENGCAARFAPWIPMS